MAKFSQDNAKFNSNLLYNFTCINPDRPFLAHGMAFLRRESEANKELDRIHSVPLVSAAQVRVRVGRGCCCCGKWEESVDIDV